MTISDPAQLLQRIPELEALATDPKIGRAIESGDPFKVFRALMLARLLRRLPGQRALLKELTGQRRLFAKPLKGTPSLATFNSLGFSFVGKAEADSDGSHIALHAVVVLFAIPLIPLGAYVVKQGDGRNWQIYARAPLGIPGWLYTRGLAAALVALVGAGAVHGFYNAGHQELLVLNGFEQPLTVAVQGQQVQVPAQGRATIALKAGQLHATAALAKRAADIVDTLDTQLVSSDRLSIWNIAGAAPLVRHTVVYTKEKVDGPEPAGAHTIYCGKRFVELADVRYRFETPPQTMSMGKHAASVSVEQIEIYKKQGVLDAALCGSYLLDHGEARAAALLLAGGAAASGWQDVITANAIFSADGATHVDALLLARRAVRARPDSLILARILQDLRSSAGEYDAMLAEHRQRAAAHPDSADELYLYAALVNGQAGIDLLQQLSTRFPQHATAVRSLAFRKAAHGDAAGALQDFQRLHALAPVDARRMLGLEARAMLAAHRPADALALLDDGANDSKDDDRLEHARDYVMLARQSAPAEKSLKAQRLGGDDAPVARDFQRACVGLAPLDPASSAVPAMRLVAALRDAPATAVGLAAKLDRYTLVTLPMDLRVLLYGEAVRTGAAALTQTMETTMQVAGPEARLLRQYLLGEPVSIAALDIDTDTQAAAMFIRSRNPRLPAAERAALRAAAAKTDVLHGAVHTALDHWQKEA